jgi:hypothetical protein
MAQASGSLYCPHNTSKKPIVHTHDLCDPSEYTQKLRYNATKCVENKGSKWWQPLPMSDSSCHEVIVNSDSFTKSYSRFFLWLLVLLIRYIKPAGHSTFLLNIIYFTILLFKTPVPKIMLFFFRKSRLSTRFSLSQNVARLCSWVLCRSDHI